MRKTENNVSARTAYIIMFFLILFTISAISLRTLMMSNNDLPTGDSAWAIKLSLEIEAYESTALIQISPPWDTLSARLFSQSSTHPELRLKRTKKIESKRDITLAAAAAGKYLIDMEFDIHVSAIPRTNLKKTELSELNRSLWLSSSDDVRVDSKATSEILNQFPSTEFVSDDLIEKLFNHVSNNVRIVQYGNIGSEITLSKRRGSPLGINNALLALLRSAHLPARLVTGINLQDKETSQPYYWAEVYDDGKWLPLDPVHGHMKQLPAFYVPLRKGGNELFIVENAGVSNTSWSIDTIKMPNQYQESTSKNTLDILNYNRLSPANRLNIAVLLLLPLGVLATELLRQIVGIRTFGTFTPTLLALAMVHVDRITALIIFSLVIVIGITMRSLLPNFDLSRTARLAIVFTLVSASMSIVTSGLIYFDPTVDSMVVLLPVVILTMLVDRIYSVSDEFGLHAAMIRLSWTLIAAFFSLLVLLQTDWGLLLVSYPEMHAITLACIIFVGLYKGPTLRTFPLFHWLREPRITKTRVKKVRATDKALQQEKNDDGL